MVLEAVVGDVAAELAAVSDRRAVVHAPPHPRIFDLLSHLRKAMIGARHFHRRIGQADADPFLPEEHLQNTWGGSSCTRYARTEALDALGWEAAAPTQDQP